MARTAARVMAQRVSLVAEPMCGDKTTFGKSRNAWGTWGSCS